MDSKLIQIRETQPEDYNNIIDVEHRAFNRQDVVGLVKDLLVDDTAEPMISLLAFYEGQAVGHVLFSKAHFKEGDNRPLMHILAPLAVVPEFQNRGIGGLLIKAGIEHLKKLDSKLVFVLGHADYYPRHGFIPDAAGLGYPAPYPILEEFKDCWMVQPISDAGMDIGKGQIGCSVAMDKPEHWVDDEADEN